MHHAIDDHSRLAYSEILGDEKKETAAAFWVRARGFFADAGISVRAVMTDNGACYRSRDFAAALDEGVRHRRTRPYRPQTNGKAERFNRSLGAEWAHAAIYASDAARAATYADWLRPSRLFGAGASCVVVPLTVAERVWRRAVRLICAGVRGHEKVPTGGQVAVPSGGQ